MSEALALMEHQEIYGIIQQRPCSPEKSISFEEMAKRHNINLNELD